MSERNKDFRLAYQIITDDIRLEKDRMWKFVYYILLMFVGIISLHRTLDISSWFISVPTTLLLTCIGICNTIALHDSVEAYRDRLTRIKESWQSSVFYNKNIFPKDSHNKKGVNLYYLMLALIIAGGTISAFLTCI